MSRWGAGGAVVAGTPHRLAAPWAALVNGTAAHALDYDDVLEISNAHVSAVLVPALLALGEERGADGAACVDAFIVGVEVMARLGKALNMTHYFKGWHTTSTLGAPAAAAACARLLRLDAAKATAALSLATSFASGAKRQFGTMTKPLHAGLAAKNGIMAAVLAESGVSAATDAYEGERGFVALFAGVPCERLEAAVADFDGPPAIERHGLWQKFYPCCASAHRPLDALLALYGDGGVTPQAVAEIDALLPEIAVQNLPYDAPADAMQARFSLHYLLASALDRRAPRARRLQRPGARHGPRCARCCPGFACARTRRSPAMRMWTRCRNGRRSRCGLLAAVSARGRSASQGATRAGRSAATRSMPSSWTAHRGPCRRQRTMRRSRRSTGSPGRAAWMRSQARSERAMAKADPVATEAAERARAFTQGSTVFDCLGLFYVLDEPYATRCLEAGVNVCNVTFALESTWDQTMSAVDEGFAKIEASPVLALARNTVEIEAAMAAGRLAVIPGTQGSSMIGKELARVGILARLGFRFFGLAYTGATLFADGCGEKRDAGLSFLGEELIAAVNETAMILDLSHTGHRSRAEAVPLARAPVCTHSNAWHHVPNDRNTKDETVRAICTKGGMMGACCLPLSVSPADQPSTT